MEPGAQGIGSPLCSSALQLHYPLWGTLRTQAFSFQPPAKGWVRVGKSYHRGPRRGKGGFSEGGGGLQGCRGQGVHGCRQCHPCRVGWRVGAGTTSLSTSLDSGCPLCPGALKAHNCGRDGLITPHLLMNQSPLLTMLPEQAGTFLKSVPERKSNIGQRGSVSRSGGPDWD